MRSPIYSLFGLILLGLFGMTAYYRTPFFPTSANQMRDVPKSVRDNPGAYRSIYGGYPRYIGGK